MRFFNTNNDNEQQPHCLHGYTWTDITRILFTGNDVKNALNDANPLREVDKASFEMWRDLVGECMTQDKYR